MRSRQFREKEYDFKKAKNLALKYLSIKSRTTHEIFSYLKNKGVPKLLIDEVVEFLREYQYVNDNYYAEMFCRSKRQKGWGPCKIACSLQLKGIDSQIIDTVIDSYAQETYSDCRNVALKKICSSVNNEKLYRFLINRGFQSSICVKVITDLMSSGDPLYPKH